MANSETTMDKLVSLCKRRGYIYPSSEIYGGLAAVYDYGPLGAELKRNIKNFWWKWMVQLREDIVGLDSAILMHPKIWEASGHVAGFQDPLVDCRETKNRYRADQVYVLCPPPNAADQRMFAFREGDDEAAAKKVEKMAKADPSTYRKVVLTDIPLNDFKRIVGPDAKEAGTLTEPRQFNLMFKTFIGPVEDSANVIYLRPETAQGIYVNFSNVVNSSRVKIPFGIAQIGKAFRNEITTENFIFRTREFEQMEMQFFVRPGTDMEWFEYWKQDRITYYQKLGIRPEKLRFHQHGEGELAHYAAAAFDIQYEFPFGWKELEGIHNRTNFDLSRHQEYSGRDQSYFDDEMKEKYIPYIIETSAGCDRTLLTVLVDAYEEQQLEDDVRTVLHLHPALAPIKAGIFPLVKKEGLPEVALKLRDELKRYWPVFYDESGAVGRRYRRQDEIGTPFCITVDFQTLQDETVTIRDRDTMQQIRIPLRGVFDYLFTKIEKGE
ncbi:MAG: glycine--tRNA ligase [candidate division KSB1 bacterium]|nr:glycine--tRNA ligase [candidate division KSB1 bacterium]